MDDLETAMFAAQYEVSCEGFTFDTCENDYLLYYYDQVRASENWTEAEVSEVTYVYGYVPSAKVAHECDGGENLRTRSGSHCGPSGLHNTHSHRSYASKRYRWKGLLACFASSL